MIHTGLVSVTFRKLKPIQIVKLVSLAQLEGIEWGGDVHVPHGDIDTAREVYKQTVESGLSVTSYGSYYRMDTEDKNLDDFKKVLDTALELHAPMIRVWAGNKGSASADENWWRHIINISRKIGDMAGKVNIAISYEYHGNTLTDTNGSALRLLKEVGHNNIKSYWQPPVNMSFKERIAGLKNILPYLTNVHVFRWVTHASKIERRPLKSGMDEWGAYLNVVSDDGHDHNAMIEFVKDDDTRQFMEDANVLKKLVKECTNV
ncbi:MAG TPA: sugar phosphate isomerase/epimerase [Clostridiaceae bacterium]|nr:sugar phosphate isomerase/epimerase [Clostridiaceae bacterium]